MVSGALDFDPGLTLRWPGAVGEHRAHAVSEWPREAVGLVDGNGAYHPCRNAAEDPVNFFEVPPEDLLAVDGGRPAALLHSHTAEADPQTNKTSVPNLSPSAEDMRAQAAMAIPWGITGCVEGGATDPIWFGDQVPRAPLYGRTFLHGVRDCYSLIRDWHLEVAGVPIPDFPRDDEWWEAREEGQPVPEMYLDGFGDAGFARVERAEGPLVGDVFICAIRSKVMNHGGVYLGDGLIAHHLYGQLSRRDPASVWRTKLGFLVRHVLLPEEWRP